MLDAAVGEVGLHRLHQGEVLLQGDGHLGGFQLMEEGGEHGCVSLAAPLADVIPGDWPVTQAPLVHARIQSRPVRAASGRRRTRLRAYGCTESRLDRSARAVSVEQPMYVAHPRRPSSTRARTSACSTSPSTSRTRGGLAARIGQRADHLDGGDADAGGERAVEGAFAEPAREAAQDVLAQELAEQVVGQGDAAGGDDVGEHQLRQPQQRRRSRAGRRRARRARAAGAGSRSARRSTAISTIGRHAP